MRQIIAFMLVPIIIVLTLVLDQLVKWLGIIAGKHEETY